METIEILAVKVCRCLKISENIYLHLIRYVCIRPWRKSGLFT